MINHASKVVIEVIHDTFTQLLGTITFMIVQILHNFVILP